MEEDRRLCENTETEKGYSEKNSKINKVMKLQQEIQRQNDLEKLRERRIMQQQEYIDKLLHSVEATMKSTETERQFNEQFEEQVRGQIYQMHGISQDKLEGMQEARRAWYQGAAFSLFFLSLVLFGISGHSGWVWQWTESVYCFLYGHRGNPFDQWQKAECRLKYCSKGAVSSAVSSDAWDVCMCTAWVSGV